jgi:hypothetical protein
MTDSNEEGFSEPQSPGAAAPRTRRQVSKVLPTERLSLGKQLLVFRAYAAASGDERKAVSNNEVASAGGDLVGSSISLCNPFMVDLGVLTREGTKQRPSDALFDYLHAFKWNQDTAGAKLYPVFSDTWAAKALLPKLTLRQLSKEEAIQTLADEAKAPPSYQKNLEILLEFLSVSGVIRVDGNSISKGVPPGNQKSEEREEETPDAARDKKGNEARGQQQIPPPADDVHRFEIPIPGKPSVVIFVPKSLEAEDWEMFQEMFGIYVRRWKGFQDTSKGFGGKPDGGVG